MTEKVNGQKTRNGLGLEMTCRRCDAFIWGQVPKIFVLAGDYKAVLCPECLNEWEVYYRDHPLAREADRLAAQDNQMALKIMSDGVDRTVELMKLRDERIAVRRQIFALAEGFCAMNVVRQAVEPALQTKEELARYFETQRNRLIQQMAVLSEAENEARMRAVF